MDERTKILEYCLSIQPDLFTRPVQHVLWGMGQKKVHGIIIILLLVIIVQLQQVQSSHI